MSKQIADLEVLVVDDEYDNVDAVLCAIKGAVKEVFYASNGLKAIQLAKEYTPDVIVMDWEMPQMNGLEAIRVLKCMPEVKDIPIIVVTGVKTTNKNLGEAFEAGATDFLKKPYDGLEFKARISSAVKIKWQHDTIEEMLKRSIEQKQRELMSMATLDHQKETMLENLLEQVDRLNRITNFVYATDIVQIQKELKAQLDLDKSWDNFKVHLEEVHDSFFEKLDTFFGKMSTNERKLAAYIKLGMSNYEIGKITGRSDEAIKKAIYRLKKKMRLNVSDDIRQFMITF